MFNPSELEGEVDHSFFDSDCDDSNISRDGGEKVEKSLKTEKESPHKGLHAKQTENIKGGRSPRTDGAIKHLKPIENNRSSRAERKENGCQSKQENRIRASSVSSIACTSDKDINNSSESDEDSNLHSKRHNGTFMALLTESREEDYKDVYDQSQNETEEEALPSNAKHRNKQSPKKRRRNRRIRSPSPTSTEASVDADSESSCSSSNGRSSLESPTLPRSKKYSLSPGVTNIQVGSAGSRDVLYSRTEESEDTLTDVSPLCSPGSSPLQLDLNQREAREGSPTEQQQQVQQQQQQESVPSSGLSNIHQDEVSDQDADECSLSSDSQLRGKLLFHCRGGRNRKNYSFTNDEVRRIDRENQRLLRELSRLSPGPRPGSTAGKKTHMASNSPHIRLSHSALNRQREQQRIERENLAFLKRLESVKPTPGIKRSEQLEDYQRQVGYLGTPSYPICIPTTKKDKSASKTPKAGPRPASSAHHSARAVSTTTDSGSTPRSKKLNAAKPAWC
ncbi:cilia- and flagella-associated protein 97 isoform X1 [Micropterus dolomieu]|uniref:cilia- and flagella-associated protein 97 isoform X1 n=1 Tax=Micropterus dolomieu TaxID=147949 RepID=UPI001E8CE6F2|nr:cilia- and flagella-associated protein 97 isoform X1 [Micropterus dolomieu]